MKTKPKTPEIRARELFRLVNGPGDGGGDFAFSGMNAGTQKGWLKLGKFVLNLEAKFKNPKTELQIHGNRGPSRLIQPKPMTPHPELKRLAEGASLSPWKAEPNEVWFCCNEVPVGPIASVIHQPDARYIAAADPQTILGLLAEVERLKIANTHLNGDLLNSRANAHDDERRHIYTLDLVHQSHAKEAEALRSRIAELETEAAELRKDRDRLDWLIQHEAYVSHSRDGEVCNVWFRWDDEGQEGGPAEGYPQKCYHDGRQAIDAATHPAPVNG